MNVVRSGHRSIGTQAVSFQRHIGVTWMTIRAERSQPRAVVLLAKSFHGLAQRSPEGESTTAAKSSMSSNFGRVGSRVGSRLGGRVGGRVGNRVEKRAWWLGVAMASLVGLVGRASACNASGQNWVENYAETTIEESGSRTKPSQTRPSQARSSPDPSQANPVEFT